MSRRTARWLAVVLFLAMFAGAVLALWWWAIAGMDPHTGAATAWTIAFIAPVDLALGIYGFS